MALVPTSLVEAPAPRGLRYGLLTAAVGPLDLPAPHGLGGGVQYEPVTCGFARHYPIECPVGVTPESKMFDPADPLTVADPFVVYATYQCTSVGHTAAELEAKVRQRLANGEQTIAESALADILAAGATPLVAPDPTSIESVVGELEEWLYGIATANYGAVGYLHAPARFAAALAFAGLLVKDGPVYRTQMGTVWSIGGGYPDDGTIYISGQTTVWRSVDILVPPVRETFDRATNQYLAIAEREYAVAYDCVAASATFEASPS